MIYEMYKPAHAEAIVFMIFLFIYGGGGALGRGVRGSLDPLVLIRLF